MHNLVLCPLVQPWAHTSDTALSLAIASNLIGRTQMWGAFSDSLPRDAGPIE
jgi:hypothetical protein